MNLNGKKNMVIVMSEKRFIVVDNSTCVFDKITKEEYVCIDREEAFLVCKLTEILLELN